MNWKTTINTCLTIILTTAFVLGFVMLGVDAMDREIAIERDRRDARCALWFETNEPPEMAGYCND